MITRDSLVGDLGRLGLRRDDLVMVHASLRRLGPVDGGADAVLDALRQVIGPGGTLVMVLGAHPEEPFDAARTPADPEMGMLAEVFRRRHGTLVNDHAAARWGASGARAREMLEPMPLHDYHGPGSILERFSTAGGAVLRLGANPETITLTHWAEYLVDLPSKRRVRTRYVRADSGEQWIEGLDDIEGIVDWPGGDYFIALWSAYRAAGRATIGPVGNCVAEHFAATDFVSHAVTWMERRLGGQASSRSEGVDP